MLKFFLQFLILLNFTCALLGQGSKVNAPVQIDAFPPAPNAASLGKYADIPVDLFTGSAQISIPLWNIKEGNIDIPISLNYQSGGIRVQEIASWVGLGWSLSSGGVITRSVRGLPDDGAGGFTNAPEISENMNASDPSQSEILIGYANGSVDSQYDLYSFNFAGRTGKFTMDHAMNRYLIPFQKIEITPNNFNTATVSSWTIRTEDGTKYEFTATERTKTQTNCNIGAVESGDYYYSSWYLTKVTTTTGQSIFLEYDTFNGPSYPVSKFEHKYYLLEGSGTRDYTSCINYASIFEGVKLKKIKYSTGEILFKSTKPRLDLPFDKSLDTIVIKDYSGKTVKSFALNYKYMFKELFIDTPVEPYTYQDATKYRLTLTSVDELNSTGIKEKPSHDFSYYSGLPDRLSNALDHWGFYNGKLDNTTLIPKVTYENVVYNGANREPDLESCLKGSLYKITYPTGGSTSFLQELHEANTGVPQSSSSVYVAKEVILNPDPDINGQSGNYGVYSPKSVDFTISANEVKNGITGSNAVFDVVVPCSTSTCGIEYVIFSKATSTEIFSTLCPSCNFGANYNYFLPNGDYSLILRKSRFGTYAAPYFPFHFKVNWTNYVPPSPTGPINYPVGGLRLKRVTDYDPIEKKQLVKAYEYNYVIDAGYIYSGTQSSGKLRTVPSYSYDYSEQKDNTDWTNRFLTLTSVPSAPLSSTSGSHIEYEQVTVYKGMDTLRPLPNYYYPKKGNYGKTIYKYTISKDFVSSERYSDGFPFPPQSTRDWTAGALLEEIECRAVQNGDFQYPIKKVVNEYNYYDANHVGINKNVKKCLGVKVAFTYKHNSIVSYNRFQLVYFESTSGYKELRKTTEYIYDQKDYKYVKRETNYTYNVDHLQMVKTETINSDKTRSGTSISYPLDYSDNTGFVKDLKDAHIINFPVEKVDYQTDSLGSNVKIKSGLITTAKFPFTVKGLKGEIYALQISKPKSLSLFKFSNSFTGYLPSGQGGNFSMDADYKKTFNYNSYDFNGNLLEYKKENDVSVSLLWGYPVNVQSGLLNSLPIAEVKNTTPEKIAFTSFENDNEGNWIYNSNYSLIDSKTGRRSFQGGNVFCNTLPSAAQKYIISFWAKNNTTSDAIVSVTSRPNIVIPKNTDWKFYKTKAILSGSVTVATNILIDDLRLYPEYAQMTSYTYDMLTGVTSVAQPNGMSTTYDYDGLQRLSLVKDNDKNILKNYIYHYKDQQ